VTEIQGGVVINASNVAITDLDQFEDEPHSAPPKAVVNSNSRRGFVGLDYAMLIARRTRFGRSGGAGRVLG
jgi:hypothetical protein